MAVAVAVAVVAAAAAPQGVRAEETTVGASGASRGVLAGDAEEAKVWAVATTARVANWAAAR